MADSGRQGLADKAGAALKPDSEKSTTEHFGDMAKGKADNVGSAGEPNSQKSYTQQAGDALGGGSTNDSSETMIDKAKNAVGLGK